MITEVKLLRITIALLVGVIFIIRSCQPKEVTIDNTRPNDTVVRKVTNWVTIDNTKPNPKPITIHDSIPKYVHVDSAAIRDKAVAEYFQYKKYNELMRNDSVAKLSIAFDVWQNSASNIRLLGTIYERTTTKIVKEYIPSIVRRKLLVGPVISYGPNYAGLGAGVMFIDKKDHAYSLGYDPFNKRFDGTIWFKIKLRK